MISSKPDVEQIIRHATGSTYCVLGPSGRALLFNLIKMLSEKHDQQRNEVLLPGYTCYSVAAAAVKAGMKIRFYDLDPQTLNPVTDSLEANCTNKTLAVLSQHLFGIPTEINTIEKIAAEKGAYHIEDAAQAFGNRHNEKPLGTNGDFGLFSFGRGKMLPLGGGGALISQKYNLGQIWPPSETSAGWRLLTINMLTQVAAIPLFYPIAEMLPLGLGQTIFAPHFEPGVVQRALTKLFEPMLKELPKLNAHRQIIAAIYGKNISAQNRISEPEGSAQAHSRFPVLAKKGPLAPELIRLGVRRLYPQSLNLEPQINIHSVNPKQRLNGAETLAQTLITLPTHHSVTKRVAQAIASRTNEWISS